jgi:hypothetical protein
MAALNKTIHTIAAGCIPFLTRSVAAPKIIPSPAITIRPSTMLGTVSLTGATGIGALAIGSVRFAPQRLQYFSSTVISLPQEGQ